MPNETPIACDMTAFTPEQRQRYEEVAGRLMHHRQETREIPDGYAFRFPPEAPLFLELAEFITLERLCCPFLDLGLEMERERGPVWLRMRGREGVKEFLRLEFELR